VTKTYEKLIRDNIPNIIKNNNQTAKIRVLSDDEYRNALNQKLHEEVNEYLSDNCIKEFCDILEVLDAIKKTMEFSNDEIERVKNDKALKNGKFDKKLFLEEVTD